MPKSKEDSLPDLSSDSGSGSEEEPKPKKKKTEQKKEKKEKKKPETAAGPKKGDNGEFMFELSSNRFVTVSEFRKRTFIGIREFYEKDGKLLPGKKGISLTPEQWERLKDHIEEIDDCVDSM